MGEYGRVTGPGTVRFERLLPGPVERVWSSLVEADKRSQWLAGGWHTHLGILEDRLAGRTPQPFFASFERIEAEYATIHFASD